LLALDLDGTLMGSDLVIDQSVRQSVAALQARGVHVTIATGRMFGATLPFAQQLGISEALICYQGALLRHAVSGEIYDQIVMPGAPAAEAVAALLERDIFVIAYIDEQLCIAEERAELDVYLGYHPEGAEVVVAPDLPQLVAASAPTKLLFVAAPDIVAVTLDELTPQFAGRLATTRSHQLFGEMTALGVSKGAMLERLAARLGVERSQVVAIGDQENDLSMIEWAGLGLAMGNAIPAVQAAADAVLPGVGQGGVAHAIERYFGIALI
jgi:Cof subfamily protein (haloacid dehalogenase superfamily)